jgi:acetyl-CoA acetyltransferase
LRESIARILETEAKASSCLAAEPRATHRTTLGQIDSCLAAIGVGNLAAAFQANIVARQETLCHGPLEATLDQGGNEAGSSVENEGISGGIGHNRAANEIAAGDATLHLAGGVGAVDRV